MITILAFEGPDKVGKSSLIAEVNKRSNYKYLCIDRFLASAFVYDSIYNRRDRVIDIRTANRGLTNVVGVQVVCILLSANKNILEERIKKQDEFSKDRLYHLDETIRLFNYYAEYVNTCPIIQLDTSYKSIDETVDEILLQLQEYENNHH